MDHYPYYVALLIIKQSYRIIAVTLVVFMAAACSREKDKIGPISLPEVTALLAPGSDSIGIVRTSDVTFIGSEQVEEYAADGAVEYLDFDLVGLGTTMYKTGGIAVFAKVALFNRSLDAFGCYSAQRPSGAAQQGIGAASFSTDTDTRFTNGIFEVVLSTETDDDLAYRARLAVASMIDGRIAQRNSKPQIYMLFPFGDQIRPSSRFVAHDFLGAKGLMDVYTVAYFMGDTLVLFLTMDEGGSGFRLLRNAAADFGKVAGTSPTIDNEAVNSQAFEFSHPEHGRVVAARVGKYLVGAVGYDSEAHEVLLSRWMHGLQ